MTREVRVDSYFSLEADLAEEMRTWPEFVSGEGYSCLLRAGSEVVETRLENDEGTPFVLIRGEGNGRLFSAVVGAVFWKMSGCSDNVWPSITRWGPIGQT